MTTNTTSNMMIDGTYQYIEPKGIIAPWTESVVVQTCSDIYGSISKAGKEENNIMPKFNFGPVSSSAMKLSPYGIAIKNLEGKYVSYDTKTDTIVDVEIFNFNIDNMLYRVPVAISDIAIGDIVYHNNVPMYVQEVWDNSLCVVDPVAGEIKEIMLAVSPFGFSYATKIINLFKDVCASPDKPFGDIWPLMMANNDNSMLPYLIMLGQEKFDPMTLLALTSKDNKDLLPFLLYLNKK